MEENPNGQPVEGYATQVSQTGVSRQTFVRGALVGGIALAAPTALSRLADIGSADAAGPKRGGRLRVGVAGGGASETLSPVLTINEIDIARGHLLYERLVEVNPDGSLSNQLAEDISPNASGTVWTIKLRPDVIFHDGSRLTADDVVYSLRYIIDPSHKTQGSAELSFVKSNNIQRVDPLTVRLVLEQPIATVLTTLSSFDLYIFKAGTTSFNRPNGTGPWKFKSWTRGERSLFVRHDQYRRHGGPYLDELEIISIDDPTTRLNSLIAGQIDAMGQLDPKLITTVVANPKLRVLQANSGGHTCQLMRVTTPPFTDNRVRQAFRLMVDRAQIVRNVQLGYGVIGNDLACRYDPDYAREIPQRPYDPEKASFLLKQAGHAGLSISLATADLIPGVLDSSVLIAEQAKKAGVTVNIVKVPPDQYWAQKYMKSPFEVTYWQQRSLDSQIAISLNSNGIYNETDWKQPAFDKITREARRTLDPTKRHELWVAAQRMLWEQGGYIIWGFHPFLDAYASNVHGLRPSIMRALGWYNFTDVYLS